MTIKTSRLLKPLFPTVLTHDDKQLIITYHAFLTSDTHTVDIKDILNLEISRQLWFAEIIIASRAFIENVITIPALRCRDAEAFVAEIEMIRKRYL